MTAKIKRGDKKLTILSLQVLEEEYKKARPKNALKIKKEIDKRKQNVKFAPVAQLVVRLVDSQ